MLAVFAASTSMMVSAPAFAAVDADYVHSELIKTNATLEGVSNNLSEFNSQANERFTGLEERATAAETKLEGLGDKIGEVSESDLIKNDNTVGQNLTNIDVELHKEIAARLGADATQDGRINELATNLSGLNKNVADGFNYLSGIDASLQGQITANDVDIAANKAAIEEEATERKAVDEQITRDYKAADAALNSKIDKLDGRVDKVGAIAVAMAGLHPLGYNPDYKAEFSMAGGSYSGETAYAAGAFYHPNEDVMFSVGFSVCGSEKAGNVGATFRFK